jgi:cytochrome c oxidase subunit 7c
MIPNLTKKPNPIRPPAPPVVFKVRIDLPSKLVHYLTKLIDPVQMLSRAATRTTTSLVTRRGFHATRARLSSPYHYPEGAYSNLPFNPRKKSFPVLFWGFMATGFFAPFGIAGTYTLERISFRSSSC